jgi:hypothetical protein
VVSASWPGLPRRHQGRAPYPGEHRNDWLTSYTYSGKGFATLRSVEILKIYEDSAPPISSARPDARAFLVEVIGIVKNAVEWSGGRFEVPKAA